MADPEDDQETLSDPMANLPKNPPIYKATGFDPEPLERAAALARGNTKVQLFEISKKEKASQSDFQKQREEAHREGKATMPNLKRSEREARQLLEKQRLEAHQLLEKHKQNLNAKASKDFEFLREESAKRLEQQKRELMVEQEKLQQKTLEFESKLKEEIDMEVIKRGTEGSIQAERANHKQRLELLSASKKERRATYLEAIKVGAATVGAGLTDFLGDSDRRNAFALTVSTIMLGIYGAKVGTGVAGRFLEARLGKPSLVRETSRDHGLSMLTSPIRRLAGRVGLPQWTGAIAPQSADVLEGIILEKDVETRLRNVARSTANTKRNNAPFRHLLLYGPPGTGKTLFAKCLAKHSGMEYAILTGGDVAPLGRDAVTEMHKVFEWAETSKRGVMLFIDEADAFLRRRATETMSEDLRNALNAFLYRTGSASNKFMVVYASNQPEQFDWAINDRIDEMVEFALPSAKERLRMIAYYVDTLLVSPSEAAKITVDEDIDESVIERVVDRTDGFSGREISKLAIAWQAAAYGTSNVTLDRALLEEVLEVQLSQKTMKNEWTTSEHETYQAITDTHNEPHVIEFAK